jgi:hypothetical protein
MNLYKKVAIILIIGFLILTFGKGSIEAGEGAILASKNINPSSGSNENDFEYAITLNDSIRNTDEIQWQVSGIDDEGNEFTIFRWNKNDLLFNKKNILITFNLKGVKPFLGDIKSKLTLGGKSEVFSGPYIEVNYRDDKEPFITRGDMMYYQRWIKADVSCKFYLNCTSKSNNNYKLKEIEYLKESGWKKLVWALDPEPKRFVIEYLK